MAKLAKIRLYSDTPLGEEQSVTLTQDQAHYLYGVMRQTVGKSIAIFNGSDGEWQADITDIGKRRATVICREQSKPQHNASDVWLMFAPIKKTRTDFIVEKATELGAGQIFPIQTEFTNADRIRQDRLQAHAVEAAEQCGGTYVPRVEPLRKLSQTLDSWPTDRHLLFCDETTAKIPSPDFSTLPRGKWAILIGPEGGFSPAELIKLRALPQTHSVSLGPRILRADTAAVSALTLWQHALGDWRLK